MCGNYHGVAACNRISSSYGMSPATAMARWRGSSIIGTSETRPEYAASRAQYEEIAVIAQPEVRTRMAPRAGVEDRSAIAVIDDEVAVRLHRRVSRWTEVVAGEPAIDRPQRCPRRVVDDEVSVGLIEQAHAG